MDISNLSEVGIKAELKTSTGTTTMLAELTCLVGPDSRFVRTQIDNVLDSLRWRLEAAMPLLAAAASTPSPSPSAPLGEPRVSPVLRTPLPGGEEGGSADPVNLQGSGPAPIVPREG